MKKIKKERRFPKTKIGLWILKWRMRKQKYISRIPEEWEVVNDGKLSYIKLPK